MINLGLTMDKHLTYEAHVDHLVQKSTGTLLALSHAKHVLPNDTLPTVVSGLVMSAIRYCLSVYGTHGSTQLQRIQRIINFGARVVSGRKKRDHISDVVRDLQWLNAKQLVSYHEMCLLKRVGTHNRSTSRHCSHVHSSGAHSWNQAAGPASAAAGSQ